MAEILRHARDFVARTLAPASPPNDGKQTPAKPSGVYRAARPGHMLPGLPGEMAWHCDRRALEEPEIQYIASIAGWRRSQEG